jgi:hypothetical protein
VTDTATPAPAQAPTPKLTVDPNVTGPGALVTWSDFPIPNGALVKRDGVFQALVGSEVTSYPDPTALSDGKHVYELQPVGERSLTATVTISAPPPSALPFWGAYEDDNPSGNDNWTDLANLETYLDTLIPTSKAVTLAALTTYTGAISASWVPANGQAAPGPRKLLIACVLGDGHSLPGTNGTLLSQCEALAAGYTAIFQSAKAMVGEGNTIARLGYEHNGDWAEDNIYPQPMPAAGVGPFVLYPAEDVNASIVFVAGLLHAVDPEAIVDFNLNGNGPNGQIDQTNGPAIDRCPMSVVGVISCDTNIGPYGVAHMEPWIALAQANGKKWAMPELVGADAADGTAIPEDITALINLANGVEAIDRGNNATFTAFEPALYVSLFSSNDDQPVDLEDSENLPAAQAWATGLAK